MAARETGDAGLCASFSAMISIYKFDQATVILAGYCRGFKLIL